MAQKRISVNQLANLDKAYGKELTFKRQFKIAVKPAIITTLFSFVLLGVVGLSATEQSQMIATMPEYAAFKAVDSKDAQTYIENIQKGKNKQFWQMDMPSKENSKTDVTKKNPKGAVAYDKLTEAYKKKSLIPNAIKMGISLWREAIFFLIGLAYGWFYVLPRQIKLDYNTAALGERNAAINLLTQAFADTTQPPIFALQVARDNTHGKLKDDFRLLSSIVAKRESDQAIIDAFKNLRHEYADDVIFDQYMEQVTTYIINGDISQKTFNNLMKQHNVIAAETKSFQQRKQSAVGKLTKLLYMSFGVGLFVALVVMTILGTSMFTDKVWGSMVGFGGALVVAGGTLGIYSLMMKNFFDNDLMSL